MIRVLHSVSYMDRAGIETILMNYYRNIDRTKIQFIFLCNKSKIGAYDEEIRKLGGEVYRTPGVNPIHFNKYLKYMNRLFKSMPDLKIVEAHNGPFGVFALYAAKQNNIPVRIYHAHRSALDKDWKYLYKMFCKSRLKNNYNYLFSCGREAAKFYFGESVVQTNRYELIRNAIATENFIFNKSVREKLRRKYGLDNKLVIGHVGRFAPQKNHLFLLKVFAELHKENDNYRLVLLGDGYLMSKVKEVATSLGVINSVLFIGNVPNANDWYQAFDIFMLPSLSEGLPVVGIEAQAADLPCVFSTATTDEVAISNKVRFVDIDSYDAWVAAVKELVTDVERRDNTSLVHKVGYDIVAEASKLQQKYIELHEIASYNKNTNTLLYM